MHMQFNEDQYNAEVSYYTTTHNQQLTQNCSEEHELALESLIAFPRRPVGWHKHTVSKYNPSKHYVLHHIIAYPCQLNTGWNPFQADWVSLDHRGAYQHLHTDSIC